MAGWIGGLGARLPLSASEPRSTGQPQAKTHPAAQNLNYSYELFSRIVYDAPTPAQHRLYDHLIKLYHHQQPWFQDKDFVSLDAENQKMYTAVLEHFFVCQVRWTSKGLRYVKNSDPLLLASGLPRSILVEITNTTDKKNNFVVHSSHSAAPPMRSFDVLPSQSKAFLLTVQVDGESSIDEILVSVTETINAVSDDIALPVRCFAPATINGRCIDSNSKAIFPGKAFIEGSDGIYRFDQALTDNSTVSVKDIIEHLPIGRQYKLPFFYTPGRFTVRVPPGTINATLQRGFEHAVASKTLTVKPGGVYDLELSSGKIVDMKEHGWISGDTHIHWVKNWWSENEDLKLLAMVQRAEDLRVANNLTLLQYRPEAKGGTFIKPDQSPMGPVPELCDSQYHIQMAEEYRNDHFYGHINLLNIQTLIMPISTGAGSGGPPGTLDYPLNKTAVEQCHRQGGISIEAHDLGPFHRSDVPANVISGLSDSLDQLKPENYYRFLDCGIQIPLTNGSDHPARLIGSPRAYVKVDGEFTYQKWIDGIRKKRTFTTSGPLVFLSINENDIGDCVQVSKGTTLDINARAISRYPLGCFELVSTGGQVIRSVKTQECSAQIELTISAEQSGWFAVRCSQNENFYVLDNPNAAHSSAIYVIVDNQPLRRPEAINAWIDLLGRHYENVKANAHYATDQQRQQQLAYIQSAIDKYHALS